MAQLNSAQYDALEDAITRSTRISVFRRGTEYVIVPLALRAVNGREMIEARNPATGQVLKIFLDEMEAVEVVK